MYTLLDTIPHFENLSGEIIDRKSLNKEVLNMELFSDNKGIGYSQFNEILLLIGLDRVIKEFFQFLCDGNYSYNPKSIILNIKMLEEGIKDFTKLALLYYGNIRFAFKALSKDKDILKARILDSLPDDSQKFTDRHSPLKNIIPISSDKSYYLGYYIENELAKRLKNPNDIEAITLEENRKSIVEIGKKNDISYLASDHMDIYVATSMRKPHEFAIVNEFIKQIEKHEKIKDLKLRIFNPTLAYCINRIDKGLSEALVLKRAKCTIYLAQETDTLGKDSELASTLAQGKVVVAFIPEGSKAFVDDLISLIGSFDKSENIEIIVLNLLKIYKPDLAWGDKSIQDHLNGKKKLSLSKLKLILYRIVKDHYNKRARDLKENHPLGIQVNLLTGVANGVIVARNIDECANLIRNIILQSLEFIVERNPKDNKGKRLKNYIYLREKNTKSIYRVKTGHNLLTTSFWNFYKDPLNSNIYENK